MKCECGYPAFYYKKYADNGKWNVYRCGHSMIESKKKTKCDMHICEYISEINCPKIVKQKVNGKEEKIDTEKLYRDNLQKYIHLCEITKNFSKKYRWNYIANINFLLRKLNFDFYFEDKETLESLKHRIKNKYVPQVIKKREFPIKLIDCPEYLTIRSKEPVEDVKKNKTIKKKKKTELINKKNFSFVGEYPEEPDEPEENETRPQEKTIQSDTESESENEDDNTFDVENYDSGDDYEDLDNDSGGFSD